MTPEHPPSPSLRDAVDRIRRNQQSPADLLQLKGLARAIALASLRRRRSQGGIHPGLLKRSVEDFADACVAELCGTGDRTVPGELTTSLAALDLAASTEQEVLVFLRRLVFVKVNAALNHAYAEADAVLGDIIQALHFCAGELGIFRESDRFGMAMLTPVGSKPFLNRPLFPLNELVDAIRRLSPGAGGFHTTIARLADLLRAQSKHACALPLITLALAYRQHLLTAEEPPDDNPI